MEDTPPIAMADLHILMLLFHQETHDHVLQAPPKVCALVQNDMLSSGTFFRPFSVPNLRVLGSPPPLPPTHSSKALPHPLPLHYCMSQVTFLSTQSGGGGGAQATAATYQALGPTHTHNRSNAHQPHGQADTDEPAHSVEGRTGGCPGARKERNE